MVTNYAAKAWRWRRLLRGCERLRNKRCQVLHSRIQHSPNDGRFASISCHSRRCVRNVAFGSLRAAVGGLPTPGDGSPALGSKSSRTCRPCCPVSRLTPLPLFQRRSNGLPFLPTGAAFPIRFTRLHIGSLALRSALLLLGNSRPRVTTAPLPHATGAYGQLPGRDFNPLDLLLYGERTDHGFASVPDFEHVFQRVCIEDVVGPLFKLSEAGIRVDLSSQATHGQSSS